ncbi:MAG TPA: class I SAM-dependent methyltransferase [Thermoanaerobaculia bacterium]|nr:class I SAM-dependent methyltransferase [Thermoanaerobaculia bacterium]
MSLAEYWNQRARDYAGRGAGFRAVCSYGMPAFYNGYIHLTQQLAISEHLKVAPGTSVLDLGCGIGRWSRQLAERGANVVGVDVAPAMIEEARRRSAGYSIDYRVADLRDLDLGRTFDVVLAVTVLQHILDDVEFARAAANVARHLAPGGRAVLLEAAPTRVNASCDTHVFRARTAAQYLDAFRAAGLRAMRITGVDPAPFKQKVLPRYRSMNPLAARAALFAATALSLPWDALLGRRLAGASWHKVFLLEHDG